MFGKKKTPAEPKAKVYAETQPEVAAALRAQKQYNQAVKLHPEPTDAKYQIVFNGEYYTIKERRVIRPSTDHYYDPADRFGMHHASTALRMAEYYDNLNSSPRVEYRAVVDYEKPLSFYLGTPCGYKDRTFNTLESAEEFLATYVIKRNPEIIEYDYPPLTRREKES